MTHYDRPRGVNVALLPPELNMGMACALGAAPDGTVYVICTEGVGWEVKAEGFKFNDYREDEKAWSAGELVEATTGETMDLADWVRMFGARLESNFHLWHRTLTKEAD